MKESPDQLVSDAFQLFESLIVSLDKIHKKGILHRDIHPGNILIRPEAKKALFTDFGCSCKKGSVEFPNGQTASQRVLRYMVEAESSMSPKGIVVNEADEYESLMKTFMLTLSSQIWDDLRCTKNAKEVLEVWKKHLFGGRPEITFSAEQWQTAFPRLMRCTIFGSSMKK